MMLNLTSKSDGCTVLVNPRYISSIQMEPPSYGNPKTIAIHMAHPPSVIRVVESLDEVMEQMEVKP